VELERPQMAIWQRVAWWIITAICKHTPAPVNLHTPTHIYTRTHAHTRKQKYVTLFALHVNNCFVNVSLCYAIRTLSC
jgi:hypothetical protein